MFESDRSLSFGHFPLLRELQGTPDMFRIIALLLLTVGCSAPRIWTTQRIGPVAIDGSVAISNGPISGTNTTQGLGLGDNDLAWSPRLDLDFIGVHINANRFATDHAGSGITESTIDFNGTTITFNTPVTTTLDLEMNTVALTFDFVPTSLVDIGLGVGAGTIEYDLDIQSLGERVKSNEDSPMGFIAIRGASTLGDLMLSVDIAWIDLEFQDTEVSFLDTDAAIAWTFFRGVGIGSGELVLGYRLIEAEFDLKDGSSTIDADLSFDGAYVGLSLGL
ncbi:MAG: hypothetical protein ACI8TQ_003006 [Planctomycetota bacterium]|jgi:hypothetical protein